MVFLVFPRRRGSQFCASWQNSSSLHGIQRYFHANTIQDTFFCLGPKNGRLITWVKTSNTFLQSRETSKPQQQKPGFKVCPLLWGQCFASIAQQVVLRWELCLSRVRSPPVKQYACRAESFASRIIWQQSKFSLCGVSRLFFLPGFLNNYADITLCSM